MLSVADYDRVITKLTEALRALTNNRFCVATSNDAVFIIRLPDDSQEVSYFTAKFSVIQTNLLVGRSAPRQKHISGWVLGLARKK